MVKFESRYKKYDKHFMEIKVVMIRANIKEDNEATMTSFMNGFNCDITHIVELYHYVESEEMVYVVVKVEK